MEIAIVASPLPNSKQTDYNKVIQYWNNEIKPYLGKDIQPVDNTIGENKDKSIDNLMITLEKIYNISDQKYYAMRQSCRDHVEKNFTVERMVESYEKTYKNILKL